MFFKRHSLSTPWLELVVGLLRNWALDNFPSQICFESPRFISFMRSISWVSRPDGTHPFLSHPTACVIKLEGLLWLRVVLLTPIMVRLNVKRWFAHSCRMDSNETTSLLWWVPKLKSTRKMGRRKIIQTTQEMCLISPDEFPTNG